MRRTTNCWVDEEEEGSKGVRSSLNAANLHKSPDRYAA